MTIATPCIAVCTFDRTSGLCMGCRRTMEEISRWSAYSNEERASIMKELRQRSFAPPKTIA